MSAETNLASPRMSRTSWWGRTIRDALIVGGLSSWGFTTTPASIGLSDRIGFGLAMLVGLVIGAGLHTYWPRDLVDRLTGPCLGLALSAPLALIPAGQFYSSILGFGLDLGALAGLVLPEARGRYLQLFGTKRGHQDARPGPYGTDN